MLDRADVTLLPAFSSLPATIAGTWSPALSPDGRHAAYVSDRSGTPAVWVQPVGSELAFHIPFPEPVSAVAWSSGGGWLACQLAPGGAPRQEVWLVRPDGSDPHQVAGFGSDTADTMRWLPGRPLLALTENLTDAIVIDVVAGTRTVIASGELISLCDVDASGRGALLRQGPRGARWILFKDLLSGTEEALAPGEQAVFSPGGGCVYVRSEDGEFPALVRLAGGAASPDALAAGRAFAGGTADVLAAGAAEVESFAVTSDGRTAAVLWNVRGGESALELVDLDHAGPAAPVTVPLPGPVVSGLAWSFDGSTLAFTAEGPGQPHGVWACDRDGKNPRAISAEPADADAVRPSLEKVTAHDGLALTGWLFTPAGTGPYPTVIWLHGGPEAQERPGHGPLFQALVRQGIAVFAPNVRGSSGSGRTYVNADNGPLRYDAIEDVRSCVRHLRDAGLAGRIGVMGRSYGGYLTLAALCAFPDLFDVGIDICGMSNFFTFYQHTEPWIAAAAISKYGDPVADAALLHDLSPIHRIDRLRAPLLVVHGENDSNVPVIEAEQVVAALAARDAPHRYLLFPGEGHELLHRASRDEFLRETLGWLTTHLQPTSSSTTSR
ncbi:dipeptidyl aminopeptidase/acylaminoacyl peptidase [Actinoplanes octamycinicus]|uniref:Dipeptidyl aminopeptidase/acylaminoacyl peptidase n=1 Tax=Actinoplanes octamycinicus TaxID=135948 RepID=A0A7W7GQS1_9ACTN|nr:alpha/beta fold hydrolase [Actinoplanes octamycinicus]MBB4736588.1 dipeptidyl aminopeptidase/acylaminoacyl peptidase [Actinoplanes octamycinicus]GIE62953.1 peptidase S9 [Actinoplanes octamycinicus]